MAISLEKLEKEAPKLIDLTKKARISLERKTSQIIMQRLHFALIFLDQ